jgi:YHS domain-containing protein
MSKHKCLLLVGFVLLSLHSHSQTSEIFATVDGAIQGYDPVAYFLEDRPVKGLREFSVMHSGVNWYFSSDKNQKVFKANPEKYLPQFGGYCAYGMSNGYKAKTEPDAFTIVDGKLYLNYNLEVRNLWNEKQTKYIIKANANWPTVKNSVFK